MTEERMEALSGILAERAIRAVAEDAETVKMAWDMAFGEAVPEDAREAVFYDEFRWHLFSYETLEAKRGDAARAAMDAKSSQRLHLFWQNNEDAWAMRNAFDLTAADVDRIAEASEPDLYIFDDEGCWTYVLTHEPDCGPYFFQW